MFPRIISVQLLLVHSPPTATTNQQRGEQGLVPAVTSELFGLENFATNYAIIMLGPAAGAAQTALLSVIRRR